MERQPNTRLFLPALLLAIAIPLSTAQVHAEDDDEGPVVETIDFVSPERDYYVINDVPYVIGRHARITDTEGRRMTTKALRPGMRVLIQASHLEDSPSGPVSVIDALQVTGR